MIKETRTRFYVHFFCNNLDWEKFNREFNHDATGVNPNWKCAIVSHLDDEEYCFSLNVKSKEEWEQIAVEAGKYNIRTKLYYEVECELGNAQD